MFGENLFFQDISLHGCHRKPCEVSLDEQWKDGHFDIKLDMFS